MIALLVKQWKLIAFVIAALVATWVWVTVGHWHQAAERVPALEKEVLREKRGREEDLANITAAYSDVLRASEGYQRELKAIRDLPVPVNTVIRVCRATPVPKPAAEGAVAGGPGPGTTTTGVLHETLDLDTRPLYGDAARCDGLSAQVRGLLEAAR